MIKPKFSVADETCPIFGAYDRFIRRYSAFAGGVAAAMLVLAGCLALSSNASAQSSKDPSACVETCKTDQTTCLHQMGTADMCGADYKVCTKTCEKN